MWSHRAPDPGSRPASAHYAMLRRVTRLPRWLLAGATGAVLGAVVGVRLGWWLVPLVVAVTVAGLLVWDFRSGLLASWPGDLGCHRLAAAVARLERRGWAVLHSPAVANQDPGRPAYLLVGPGGVFVVEHQVWPAGERVTTNPTTGLLEVAGRPAARRTTEVRAAAAAVDEAVSDALSREVPVYSVLAVHGLALDQPRDTAGVTLLPIPDLVPALRRRGRVLSPGEVDRVASTARHLFAPSAWT